MKEYSQLTRIIHIIQKLSCGYKLTTREIYTQFNKKVPLRTIQRDLQNLEEAGLPFEKNKNIGNENVWSLPSYYKNLIPPVFHQNEITGLHFLKSYLKNFGNTHISKWTDQLIEKLEDYVPGDIFVKMLPDQEIFFNQNKGCYNYDANSNVENKIIEAINNKEWLEISYLCTDYKNAREFLLFPHGIFLYQGSLYVASSFADSDEYFSVLLHFIKDVKAVADPPEKKPVFNHDIFNERRFGMYSGNPVTVKLMIENSYLRYFVNRIWHTSQKIYQDAKGRHIIEMKVPLAPELINWVTGWSSGITVLEPEELKDMVKERAEIIHLKYS